MASREIDKHTKWAALASLNVHHINPQVAYDDVSGRFFIAGGRQLFVYDVKANRIDSIAYKGHPYIGASSRLFLMPNETGSCLIHRISTI